LQSTIVDPQAALTLDVSSEGVAWLVFDRPSSRVNLLTMAVMTRLDELLGEIESKSASGSIRALIVRSGKEASFIAGADINEIRGITTEAEGEAASREGQRIFRRLELLHVPTIAAVDGICVGGGLELILACGHRIASERPETRLGLPEIRLGIIPGFGGTTRLPRLIGLRDALPLILTGKPIPARKAQRIGLVDEAVHPHILYERASALASEAIEGRTRRRKRQPLTARLLNQSAPGRALVLSQARKQVVRETRGHYPAPLVAVETISRSIGAPLARAFEYEAKALGSLIPTPVSKNLIHVFELMEGAKRAGPRARPRDVEQVGVLGAGVMGGGIAQLLASNDVFVRLKDIRADAIGQGLRHARELFDKAVQRGRLKDRDAQRHMDHIVPTLDYSGFGTVDLVIEAVVERMDVKKDVLSEVESRVPESCVLTSNTSSLSISDMQSALDRPEDFCGMHFFNPVHRMPLVEVIRGKRTSDEAVSTVFALARRLDKTPIIVNDGPGFLVNRILSPYLNEAGWLLAEGASIKNIDDALLDFGMPMGPLRLLDEIGLDVARHAGTVMYQAFGERMKPAPPLEKLGEHALLGRKGKRGFYVYDGRKQTPNVQVYEIFQDSPRLHQDASPEEICARTVFSMVNEAARILADGIVRSAGDVDLGMITGTGFPPFRGGLLRYADSLGLAIVLDRLEAFARDHGPRFEPAPLLVELASSGRTFYQSTVDR
jgi:3-hydroxyacyl-CoA dehydrogenase/enoyl-CoA hydratase/3-hydroxybutyryl-CoA epimerase